jgi:SAM-dependent methyltransferase
MTAAGSGVRWQHTKVIAVQDSRTKPLDLNAIRVQVRERFAALAISPSKEKRFEIGRASALKLGYDPAALAALPPAAVDRFAGVGNPLLLAPLTAGMTVLDLGCGSGVDTLLAAQRVGPRGKVIGVDMTEPMVTAAQPACAACGAANVETRLCTAQQLGIGDESVDVVISNGVINLCPDKEQVLREIHRVLRPGGRLQVADMSLVDGVNPELLERVGQWSD